LAHAWCCLPVMIRLVLMVAIAVNLVKIAHWWISRKTLIYRHKTPSRRKSRGSALRECVSLRL
jgi:hypothetical protein